MSKFLLSFILWLACTHHVSAQHSLRFLMPDYPPYTYQVSGQNQGLGYEAVAAIMADIQQPFSVQLVPHFGHAVSDMQRGVADGFFLATESAERNQVAEFSEPVLMIEWTWVWLKQRTDLVPDSSHFKHNAQVSAQSNSNIHRWLEEHHYQVTAGTTDIRGLLNLLNYKRVDAILLPELTVNTLLAERAVDADLYSFQQEISLPFAIYINKNYLKKHPHFMQKLNAAIGRYQHKATANNTQS
ncbi:MAG: transporter substrate-binding domain-containing protein [Gammaproteobacteria bacterium]|nr:transporter substrate-binding domain-containing protein [Gammaproteobacteria bacterium]MBU2056512.1 transporter substrate-binding domain-containing protein [Gammaproteobacteria bacterium]MBU2174225.1 transporter substrate-binding domain-containing protein [Gammaproteobacteria bacterium]MBU2248724.1 transporter substrate-binding domain-containing protein [Gammaproteobacteria bacterium]MBU2344638.1 transporter substrate-binding domain-containing protein [Gammaproteobacteria bacterium]